MTTLGRFFPLWVDFSQKNVLKKVRFLTKISVFWWFFCKKKHENWSKNSSRCCLKSLLEAILDVESILAVRSPSEPKISTFWMNFARKISKKILIFSLKYQIFRRKITCQPQKLEICCSNSRNLLYSRVQHILTLTAQLLNVLTLKSIVYSRAGWQMYNFLVNSKALLSKNWMRNLNELRIWLKFFLKYAYHCKERR